MPTTQPEPERRRAPRFDLHLDVTVNGQEDAITENVSSSGVLLILPTDTKLGSEIVMDMDIPPELGGDGRVRFRAEVVRVDDHRDGHAVGARFIDWQVLP